MGTSSLEKRRLKQILKDPNATAEQVLAAVRTLERIGKRRGPYQKTREQNATEITAQNPSAGISAPGWQVWIDDNWSPAAMAAQRALWAKEIARGLPERRLDSVGGPLTAWELEQGRKILAGTVRPIAYSRGIKGPVYSRLAFLPPAKDDLDCYNEHYAPLPAGTEVLR